MVLLLLSMSCMHSFAQDLTVTGKVTEESGGEVAGVNVVVKGTSRGTTTNDKGEYSISVEKGKTLTFSFIGFNSKEVTVGSESVIDVSLPTVTSLL